MIKSIQHKGVKLYHEEGKSSKLPAAHTNKIRRILTVLDAITSEDDIKKMGSGIHRLKRDLSGFWAVTISGNYRIIFRFESGDVFEIDYLDYH
jgi:proteic killer suppression protein